MKMTELHPSNYLKAGDLDEDFTLTMKGIKMEGMKDSEGNEEDKPVLYFREVDKGLVLNATNKKRILAMHPAEDTDEWIGKQVTLTKEWVEAFGKSDWAIRVKVQPPQRKPAPAPQKPAPKPVAESSDEVPF